MGTVPLFSIFFDKNICLPPLIKREIYLECFIRQLHTLPFFMAHSGLKIMEKIQDRSGLMPKWHLRLFSYPVSFALEPVLHGNWFFLISRRWACPWLPHAICLYILLMLEVSLCSAADPLHK